MRQVLLGTRIARFAKRTGRGAISLAFLFLNKAVRTSLLLLEEVVERAAGVVGAARRCRCLALHRDMQREERALIARALVGNALRQGLGALKMLAGIEVGALPAGMEF